MFVLYCDKKIIYLLLIFILLFGIELLSKDPASIKLQSKTDLYFLNNPFPQGNM